MRRLVYSCIALLGLLFLTGSTQAGALPMPAGDFTLRAIAVDDHAEPKAPLTADKRTWQLRGTPTR